MTTADTITQWSLNNPLSPEQVDCVTTVMLKILDGKCKMKAEEKDRMLLLYDQVKTQQGKLMGEEMHQLINHARNNLTDDIKDVIYEKRVLAETTLSRPVMKAFKAMIRQRGLFNNEALPLKTISIPD
ncbi:hypothetical protein AU255_15485 [Methyloprofundus sedimenti]|uniref:Uncharacterized protein n=1 Tax=Methyloprofundus sedimenti TaxID=1420851 RepID=A0A1V8M239_9GAMM|nr:hypothetical protein [Methyloprofundus sedimenti]OQK15624.1 hypothetical protein AU255_15485 [Methyloprofundus sedimenti]